MCLEPSKLRVCVRHTVSLRSPGFNFLGHDVSNPSSLLYHFLSFPTPIPVLPFKTPQSSLVLFVLNLSPVRSEEKLLSLAFLSPLIGKTIRGGWGKVTDLGTVSQIRIAKHFGSSLHFPWPARAMAPCSLIFFLERIGPTIDF